MLGRSLLVLVGIVMVLVLLAVALPPATAPLPDAARDARIDNVRIVDVEAGTVSAPTSLTIRKGRISAIGAPASADRGLARVDAGGRFLTPGLWDMHVHSFQSSPQLHFPLALANGVTSMRDMMDCPQPSDSLIACHEDKRRWNAAIERGGMSAPRIASVASFYFDRPAMSPTEAVERAREYRARGLRSLKVYNWIEPATYRALAAEARASGMGLVGHLPTKVRLDEAAKAGQSSFEHAHLLVRECSGDVDAWRAGKLASDDPTQAVERWVATADPRRCADAVATLRASGAAFVPTHVTREEDARADDPTFVGDARLDFLDPLSRWAYRDDLGATANRYGGDRGRNALRAYFDRGLRLTGEAHRAGVPVLVGTDTAIGGFRYHDELRHLAKAGLSNAAILRAATIDAARFAGQGSDAGSIALGKRADFVLLDEDPLVDIRHSTSIRAVWLGGRHYDRALLDDLLDFTWWQARNPLTTIRLLLGFARSSVASEL